MPFSFLFGFPFGIALLVALMCLFDGLVIELDFAEFVSKGNDLSCPLVKVGGGLGGVPFQRIRVAGGDEGRLL